MQLTRLLTHKSPNSTVFTNIAPTLALSSFPILGSLQQCGELLRRECQDDSTLSVLPRVCALYQGLQGEDAVAEAASVYLLLTSLLVSLEVPWFVSLRAEQGRALAASVPQDVAL